MVPRLTNGTRDDLLVENCANCLKLSTGWCPRPRSTGSTLGHRWVSGWARHHTDEVVQVRTVKRMPEERRWQAERVLRLDALPWFLRPKRVKEQVSQRRRRYITWNYIRKYCKACTVDSTHHNKQCSERFQGIFDREDGEAQRQEQEPRSAPRQGSRQAPAAEAPHQLCPLKQSRRRLQVHLSEQTLFPWRIREVRQSFNSYSQWYFPLRTW